MHVSFWHALPDGRCVDVESEVASTVTRTQWYRGWYPPWEGVECELESVRFEGREIDLPDDELERIAEQAVEAAFDAWAITKE